MNSTIKYILNNMRINIIVILIIAMVFIIQLMLTLELWTSFYPAGSSSLSGACYGFEIAKAEKEDIQDVILEYPSDLVNPLDIQLAGYGSQNHFQLITDNMLSEEEFDTNWLSDYPTDYIELYAPLTQLSEKRINQIGSYDSSEIKSDTVVLIDHNLSISDINLNNYVYISEQPYLIVGIADVFEADWDNKGYQYLCSIDTVLESTSRHVLVFQYNEPLKNSDYDQLLSYVTESFEITEIYMPYVLDTEQSAMSQRLILEVIILVIVCLCLIMSFIDFVIETRNKEYRIYRICGARGFNIVMMIVLHISFLCVIAETISWAVFFLIMHYTKLTALDSIPIQWALINSLLFWALLIIVLLLYRCKDHIQIRRLGLSRTVR